MAIIRPFQSKSPRIASTAFIAENATIIGDVEIGPDASIWYGVVLRGDVGTIRIGARSNIQDLSMIHMTGGAFDTIVGDDVVVGHGVILHSSHVGNGALVGMGAILLDDCAIGEGAVVAAGSVVPPRMVVPPYTMVRGSPAKPVRELKPEEREMGRRGAAGYTELMRHYRDDNA
jgi:carbonic anhydrase/acetyltransferase-like protein (isoleucine patch superfamily)